MIDCDTDDINNRWIMVMSHNSRANAMHGQTQDRSWIMAIINEGGKTRHEEGEIRPVVINEKEDTNRIQ